MTNIRVTKIGALFVILTAGNSLGYAQKAKELRDGIQAFARELIVQRESFENTFLLRKNNLVFEQNASTMTADSLSAQPQKRKPKKPRTALVRAAVFPGWGQMYTEKYFKAVLVFGVQATLAGYSIYYNNKVSSALSAEEKEIWVDRRNTNYGRHAIVILLSMLDAYIDAHLYDFDAESDFSPAPEQKYIASPQNLVNLGYRFSF